MTISEMLIQHESLELFPYLDTTGHLTIGVGRNLNDRGITKEEALFMLDNDIKYFTSQLQKELPYFDSLPDNVKMVLLDMAFNLGISGLLTFKKTLAAIERGDYKSASKYMLNSRWAIQVGVRAIELSDMLLKI